MSPYAGGVAQARLLLRPRWLLSHLLVVVLVVAMVNLGFWQLRRLDQRRDHNELIIGRQAEPVVAIDELLDAADRPDEVDAVRFRNVTVTGSYEVDGTIEIRNRTLGGVPGVWVVTPLRLDNGDQVGIVRGFSGLGSDGSADVPAPQAEEVTITGTVVSPQRLDGTAPRDAAPFLEQPAMLQGLVLAEKSEPPEAAMVTPDQLAGNSGADVDATLHPVPLPELSEGPHLAYAVQWFIFATIAVVGYPLVLRRVIQRRGKEVDDIRHATMTTEDDLDRQLEEILHRGSRRAPS